MADKVFLPPRLFYTSQNTLDELAPAPNQNQTAAAAAFVPSFVAAADGHVCSGASDQAALCGNMSVKPLQDETGPVGVTWFEVCTCDGVGDGRTWTGPSSALSRFTLLAAVLLHDGIWTQQFAWNSLRAAFIHHVTLCHARSCEEVVFLLSHYG